MMRLGSIGGTTIDVDATFFLLTAFFVITEIQPGRPIAYALMWAPIVFISVLLHELAHAAALASFGLGPSHIVLGGIGGLTMNESARAAWKQIFISAAGPLMSFAIAFACRAALPQRDPMLAAMLPAMAFANLWWGVFNLLPVIPLDGGQAMHNLLRTFLSERAAVNGAVWIGIVTAVGVALYAVLRGFYFAAALMAMFAFRLWQGWSASRANRDGERPPD